MDDSLEQKNLSERPFLLPVVDEDISDRDEKVPDRFREVQWTRLPGGQNAEAFVERVRRLVSPEAKIGASDSDRYARKTIAARCVLRTSHSANFAMICVTDSNFCDCPTVANLPEFACKAFPS
jgi:hypothetical protein